MNILHAVSSIHPAAGGLPVVALSQAAAQASAGHHVVLLFRAGLAASGTRDLLERIPDIQQVRLLSLTSYAQVYAHFKHHGWPFECVHLHGVWDPMLFTLSLLARSLNTPYCVTPHGMLAPWSLTQSRHRKRLAFALGYQRMLRQAKFIQCLNSGEQQELIALGLGQKTRVVPNGIFTSMIETLPEPGTSRRLFPELADTPFLLFLSRIHHKKGLDRLLSAFAIVCNDVAELKLVVCGPDGGAEPAARAQAKALGISDRVLFLGPVYGRAKYGLLVDATCFCLPSRQEGFSLAITEALACALPVIITPECQFPEVDTYRAGWISSGEPERLAEVLLVALRNVDERITRGKNGQRLVLQRFTWQPIAEQLLCAYAEPTCPSY